MTDVTDGEQVRAGRREANLRLINERIADNAPDVTRTEDELVLLCECAHESCNSTIGVDTVVFDRVRDDSRRFIVLDGHVLHEVEDIVERGPDWILVEKRGTAAQAARRVLDDA